MAASSGRGRSRRQLNCEVPPGPAQVSDLGVIGFAANQQQRAEGAQPEERSAERGPLGHRASFCVRRRFRDGGR